MVACKLCCISRSDDTVKQGITFHCVPKVPEVRKEWLQFIFEEIGEDVQQRKKIHLCSRHFETQWFTNTPERARLKKTAVPSISSRETRKEKGNTSPVVVPWPWIGSTEDANPDRFLMEPVDHVLVAQNSGVLDTTMEESFREAPSDPYSSQHYTNGARSIRSSPQHLQKPRAKNKSFVEPMDVITPIEMVVNEIVVSPDAIPNENMVDTTYAKNGMMATTSCIIIDDSSSDEEDFVSTSNRIRENLAHSPSDNGEREHRSTDIWPEDNFVSSSTGAIRDTLRHASSSASDKSYSSSVNNNDSVIEPIYISSDEENDTNDNREFSNTAHLKSQLLKLRNLKERREKQLELFKMRHLQIERGNAKLHLKYVSAMKHSNMDKANNILSKCGKNKEFIRRYLAKRAGKSVPDNPDSSIDEFALELNRISPEAYVFFRTRFLDILPQLHSLQKQMDKTIVLD